MPSRTPPQYMHVPLQLFNPMGLALINPLDRGLRTLEVTNFRN